MFSTLSRPYKKSNASDTIFKIKNILKKIDLTPSECFYGNPYPQIYSTRISLPTNEGGFGTNGKGRTPEYSLASAYAEFMERLQNNLYASLPRTMVMKLKENQGFYYVPDEKYIGKEEILSLPEDVLTDLVNYGEENKENFINSYYERLIENNIEGIVAIPFYDTINNKLIYLPYNLLIMTVGSNGMAAGNTVSEAVFQSMCELMERWGSAEMFYNQITPPTVPLEYLMQFKEEYNIIKNIEQSGKYKIIIKDFSCNKRIPAVGIIIINTENNKYRLNVGADTSFQVALSRCITEIYQGTENEDKFDNSLLDIPKEVPEYFIEDNENAKFKQYIIFSDFTKNDSGVYPPSLFEEIPDYDFDATVFTPKESYEKEVADMICNLHAAGHNVYIRDCSYLDFPSVMVYIPEVSALGRKNVCSIQKISKFNQIELDKIEKLLFNMDTCKKEDISKIEKALTSISSSITITDIFSINMKSNSISGNMTISFFLILLRYRLGKYDKALESLKEFMSKGTSNDIYYEVVMEYLKLKRDGYDHKDILNKILNNGYEDTIVLEVCKDLENDENIFNNVVLPKCPNCSLCGLKDECLTKTQMIVFERLYLAMKNNILDQNKLADLLI